MHYKTIYQLYKGHSDDELAGLRQLIHKKYKKVFNRYGYVIDVEGERILTSVENGILKEMRRRGMLPKHPREEFRLEDR